MPIVYIAYLNNVRIRGPLTTYNNTKDLPKIQRFI
jgi:hypothetical protein